LIKLRRLTNEPVLSLFQQGREHVIQTDACNEQIGATLLQREDDGELHPVLYARQEHENLAMADFPPGIRLYSPSHKRS